MQPSAQINTSCGCGWSATSRRHVACKSAQRLRVVIMMDEVMECDGAMTGDFFAVTDGLKHEPGLGRHIRNSGAATPLGLGFAGFVPSFLATLGFETESLWDSFKEGSSRKIVKGGQQTFAVTFPGVIPGTLASGNGHPVAQGAILHDLLDGQGESVRIALRDEAAIKSVTNDGARRVGGDYWQAGGKGFVGGFRRALRE